MWPSYLWNALHYLPSRATPPNLGVKIPGSHLHTHARWGFDLSVLYCHGITSTHLHLSGVKPCQFEARECSNQATSVLTLVSLKPTTSHTQAKNYTIAPLRLDKYYTFERAETPCEYFNKFINTLKKEREQIEPEESYPWLDSSDERKYMPDREISDKYIDLDRSCLKKEEKKEVMEILHKYKEVFSLKDEIGTCPNIEVEIDVTDKSPFFHKTLPC